jgi:hypothetical protein
MILKSNIYKNMENNFCVFILSHGRPDNVITYETLKRYGYKGKIYIVIDNEDTKINDYIKKFGIDNVKIFNKKELADNIDEGNNFDNRKVIVHARNACFQIAKELGIEYFVQFDDDYYYFGYRYDEGAKKIQDLDKLFKILLDFYKSTNIKSIAFSQGGDHIGGFSGIKMKRKCMNSFFCSTGRPINFIGSINEDVNTYVRNGSIGDVFFTFTNLQLDQKDTQSQNSGMTDAYKLYGTYLKSFTTVLYHPSSVKVSMMNSNNPRLHHSIKWLNTTPMILSNKYKKQ